jgi:ribose-phosphate pyrophosphokinase
MPLKQRISTSGKTLLKVFSGTANPELAKEIADYLGIEIGHLKITPFSDGEIYV